MTTAIDDSAEVEGREPLTVVDASARLQVGRHSVYRWLEAGLLRRADQDGLAHGTKIDPRSVDELLAFGRAKRMYTARSGWRLALKPERVAPELHRWVAAHPAAVRS